MVKADTDPVELVRALEVQAVAGHPVVQKRLITITAQAVDRMNRTGSALRPWREYSMALFTTVFVLMTIATVSVVGSLAILIGLSLEKVLAFPHAVVISAICAALGGLLVWPAEVLRARNKEIGNRAGEHYVTFVALQVITMAWLLLRAWWYAPGDGWLAVAFPAIVAIPAAIASHLAVYRVYRRNQLVLAADRNSHDRRQDAIAATGPAVAAILSDAEKAATSAMEAIPAAEQDRLRTHVNAALAVLERRGVVSREEAELVRSAPLGSAHLRHAAYRLYSPK
jgi:hypothetical protein